ncbi:MAG: GIY-YIG nuclease family protein [Bacteroidia bacterium]
MNWSVYLLKCKDGSYYTGCTNNLDDRIVRHNKGEIHYTSIRLPFELVTHIVFTDKYKAYNFEKYLKSGSGKAFAFKRLV